MSGTIDLLKKTSSLPSSYATAVCTSLSLSLSRSLSRSLVLSLSFPRFFFLSLSSSLSHTHTLLSHTLSLPPSLRVDNVHRSKVFFHYNRSFVLYLIQIHLSSTHTSYSHSSTNQTNHLHVRIRPRAYCVHLYDGVGVSIIFHAVAMKVV